MKRIISTVLVLVICLTHFQGYSSEYDTTIVVVDIPQHLYHGHLKAICYATANSIPSAFSIEIYPFKESWSLKLNSNSWMYEKGCKSKILTLNSEQKISITKKIIETLSNKLDLSNGFTLNYVNSDFADYSVMWSRERIVRDIMSNTPLKNFNKQISIQIFKSKLFKSIKKSLLESGFTVSNVEISHVYTIDDLCTTNRFIQELHDFDLRPDDIIINCDIKIYLSPVPENHNLPSL